MARSSPSRPDDNDCLRLPATPSPRTRGAEKKESTGLHLNQPCPPYVTPSSISSLGGRLSGVRTAENKSLKNSGANTFCQSSARSTAVPGGKNSLSPGCSFSPRNRSPIFLTRMKPLDQRNHALRREPDHVNRRSIS